MHVEIRSSPLNLRSLIRPKHLQSAWERAIRLETTIHRMYCRYDQNENEAEPCVRPFVFLLVICTNKICARNVYVLQLPRCRYALLRPG